ncbi:hypothetical protein ABZV31_07875 [Streptomyces sp. NPDC005202]|uniref:hypothetical protein n=1 Tax=Streptomyces sp. NPDC005202 TaxID=3157021 RepID=UPI0033A346FD
MRRVEQQGKRLGAAERDGAFQRGGVQAVRPVQDQGRHRLAAGIVRSDAQVTEAHAHERVDRRLLHGQQLGQLQKMVRVRDGVRLGMQGARIRPAASGDTNTRGRFAPSGRTRERRRRLATCSMAPIGHPHATGNELSSTISAWMSPSCLKRLLC